MNPIFVKDVGIFQSSTWLSYKKEPRHWNAREVGFRGAGSVDTASCDEVVYPRRLRTVQLVRFTES